MIALQCIALQGGERCDAKCDAVCVVSSYRWAVGVLLFFMLQNELPFGSWRDNELDIFVKIARRQLVFPSSFSGKVVDLIDKV